MKEILEAKQSSILNSMKESSKRIAPLWPLENFVAVNPFFGMSDHSFSSVAKELKELNGINMTMPLAFYLDKIESKNILEEDIEKALINAQNSDDTKIGVHDFIEKISSIEHEEEKHAHYSIASIGSEWDGKDWKRFAVSRISNWAASYFDKGQALWNTSEQNLGIYEAWKYEAEKDLSPQIIGLNGFRQIIKSLPDNSLEATKYSLEILGIGEPEREKYFSVLLRQIGGWSAYIRQLDWEQELKGKEGKNLVEFIAILVCWEAGLYLSLNHQDLEKKWTKAKLKLRINASNNKENKTLEFQLILQKAFDYANQRATIDLFQKADKEEKKESSKTKAQAVFCIDVRSEVYRRKLEAVNPEIETLGFAGFFGFPVNFIPLAHEEAQAQCPVLLNPGPTILETHSDKNIQKRIIQTRSNWTQIEKIWKSFKSGAITCFSFVSPLGLYFLPKLFTDSYGLTRPVANPSKIGLNKKTKQNLSVALSHTEIGNAANGIPQEQQVQFAKNALRAMSLTENFAPYVLIVGHGSTSINNPHASGLDCGACGGHSGDSNAQIAATVLNNKAVREALQTEGINIPTETVFLACLHDTTSDEVSILNQEVLFSTNNAEFKKISESLKRAGQASRIERASRMSITKDIDESIKKRSNDWSQVRPEWGLAGCSNFVIAPRTRTQNIDFKGTSFLHSYNWKKDQDSAILELIMTAPMIVTSWINLQYYASTVDNKNFGSGNKTLHNVTSGIGVIEGHSGDLRTGLPIQSVFDGEKFQHEPKRLNVYIEAPLKAINSILEKHQSVRDLIDNSWINILAIDENGLVSYRYIGGLEWESIASEAA